MARRRKKVEFRVLFPQYDFTRKKCVWPGLHLASIPGKNVGVVATETLAKYSLLPYLGERLTKEEFQTLSDMYDWDHPRVHYLFQESSKVTIDGFLGRNTNKTLIASYVNEPSTGERIYCISMKCPRHRGVFLMTIKTIKKGEELLYSYGSEYQRNYPVGKSLSYLEIRKLQPGDLSKHDLQKLEWLIQLTDIHRYYR